jgi:hypothetical protein
MSNPFHSQPILPYGREEIIREIFGSLSGAQGAESFSLVGPKYMGKTAILRSLTQVQHDFPQEQRHLIYLDCGDLPLERREVFRLLGLEAAKATGVPLPVGLTAGQEANAFERLLLELEERGVMVIFILDDFEKLLALFTEADVQFMRGLFANSPHALVTATPRLLQEYGRKTFSSKFYEIFKRYRLRSFSRDQAYDYLTETPAGSARQFSHVEKEMVLRKAGGHPHFLRLYAAELWRYKLRLLPGQPVEHFAPIDRKVAVELDTAFLSLWEGLERDLQTALYQFAAGDAPQESLIRTLQRLEEEHGLVYRTAEGRFELMGELLKEFVVARTELLDYLLKTDFYRAGLRALKQVEESRYFETDPQYYYQKAYQQFTAPTPDYDSANAMIRAAFERLLDVMVKRAEPVLGRPFVGGMFNEKMEFIEEAFAVEDRIARLLRNFWSAANEDGPHAGKQATPYNTQLRFYLLSGAIQYLLHAPAKAGSS